MLRSYCRLCLSSTSESAKNIFDKDHNAVALVDQLNELFNLKYDNNAQYPQKICEYCKCMVAQFSSFVQCVHLCESEMKKRFAKLDEMVSFEKRAGLNDCEGVFNPEGDADIVEIDPFLQIESSDEDFSMDDEELSDHDQNTYNNDKSPVIEKSTPITVIQQTEVKPINNYSPDLTTKNAYLCKICDRAFTSQSGCTEHESIHNPHSPYTCSFCQFNCVSRQTLISHIKELHDAERPYICALCQKGFCRRSDLKKHTIVHTGVRPFTCSICAKSFSRNTNLTKHMRIHSSVKPHVCQRCPRSFCTTTELIRHTALHTDVKAFQCSHCPSSFTRRDKLQLHENTHHVDIKLKPKVKSTLLEIEPLTEVVSKAQNRPSKHYREYSCEICGKSFMRERDLQRHKALHLDSLFSCKQCGSGFSRREKLKRHEQEVHGAQFKCKDCHLTFSNKNSLDEHLKTHDVRLNGTTVLPTSLTTFPVANTIPQPAQQPIMSNFSFYSQLPTTSMALGFYSEQNENT